MIKRFIYRDTPEMIILVFIALMCIPLVFVLSESTIWLILAFIAGVVLILEKWNKKINSVNNFFWCKHSIFCKKRVWIVQHASGTRNIKECAQYRLAREMSGLLNDIADGTVCYCCTHEVIKKHIVKKYPSAELTPIYKKNIKRLKKAIRTNACKKCSKKECSIFRSQRVQFYAVKFRK